jgi:toxin ParE1/3/4
MKKYEISFRPVARDDLISLYNYIADRAGLQVAESYVARIEEACASLEHSPLRGPRRDDIHPGLRSIGFERRATILFRVRGTKVVIVRIFYGGRDYEGLLRNAEEI